MVGFNRRFAPLSIKIKKLVDETIGPKSLIYTVNAGQLPADHWTLDPMTGGGRIIGEACHFIDLIRFFVGHPITDVSSNFVETATKDTVTIQLKFADGSIGTVHYFSNGAKRLVKERLEIFSNGKHLLLNNFRQIKASNWPGAKASLWAQDKGQVRCAQAFVDACRQGKPSPIGLDEILEVTRAAMHAAGTI